MSLINQMLKDLEKRAQTTPKSEVALIGLQSVIAPKFQQDKKYYMIFIALFLTAIVISISLLMHSHSRSNDMDNEAAQNSIQATSNESQIAANDEATPTQITPAMLTGATLQVLPSITHLRLLLNQNILYKISSAQDEQELTLILENTNLVAALPAVNFNGSAIQNLQTTTEPNGNLKIVLSLNAGAHIANLDLIQGSSNPELQVDIAYQSAVPQQQIVGNSNSEDMQVLNLKKPVQVSNTQQLYQHAINLSEEGLVQQSSQVLKELLQQNPTFIPAREKLIDQLVKAGNLKEAEQVVDVGLKQTPNQINFAEMKARFLVTQNKVDSALDLLQGVAPPLEVNPDYHAFIAALYQKRGEAAVAAEIYAKLLALQPSNAKWWVGLGIALEDTGKHNQALAAYNRAESSGQLTPELRAYIRSRMDNTA